YERRSTKFFVLFLCVVSVLLVSAVRCRVSRKAAKVSRRRCVPEEKISPARDFAAFANVCGLCVRPRPRQSFRAGTYAKPNSTLTLRGGSRLSGRRPRGSNVAKVAQQVAHQGCPALTGDEPGPEALRTDREVMQCSVHRVAPNQDHSTASDAALT